MAKSTPLLEKKIGDTFYYRIWKYLSVGDVVDIKKGSFIFTCKIVERCGTDKYKFEIIERRKND